ncbi:MAG: 3-hydroxyacyl-CoA dehydrogenase family protein [Chloroflexi bacterium]|nr:3-hydroxyacyl-CoA dehydrogenase family protein [Chloroflexota bacterium]
MANRELSTAVTPAPAEAIARLAVIGAGTLGWQIACLGLARGFTVALHDVAEPALARARDQITAQLAALAASGDSRAPAEALAVLTTTTDLTVAAGMADFIIESVPESVPLKQAVFAALDRVAPPAAILATNSSSFRSRLLADATTRPDRVLNFHFVNFPWRRPYLEIMTCGATSAASLATVAGLAERLGLRPVVLRGEVTGFLYGRIWRAVKREAIAQLERGIATAEEIDLACQIGMNMPDGPLRMMDRIGLDVILAIEEHYAAESGDPRDAPPAIVQTLVAAGHLGRKTGRGFYDDYDAPGH